MYARITTFQCDPSRLDDLSAKLDEIRAQAKAISGVLDVYTVWRADGKGVTTGIYVSQADAEAATSQVQAIWSEFADILVGAPSADAYENVVHLTA